MQKRRIEQRFRHPWEVQSKGTPRGSLVFDLRRLPRSSCGGGVRPGVYSWFVSAARRGRLEVHTRCTETLLETHRRGQGNRHQSVARDSRRNGRRLHRQVHPFLALHLRRSVGYDRSIIAGHVVDLVQDTPGNSSYFRLPNTRASVPDCSVQLAILQAGRGHCLGDWVTCATGHPVPWSAERRSSPKPHGQGGNNHRGGKRRFHQVSRGMEGLANNTDGQCWHVRWERYP